MVRKSAVDRLRLIPRAAALLASTGGVRPQAPLRTAKMVTAVARWGVGAAGGYTSLATRCPHTIGLIDERGALTFGQVHERTNALAHALADRGIGAGDAVAIVCRNHRGLVEATVAAAKIGADVLYLDTAIATSPIDGLLNGARPAALVFDEEFADLLAGVDVDLRLVAWHDGDPAGNDTLESLIEGGDITDPVVPPRRSRSVVLASEAVGSTTAAGRAAGFLESAASLLSVLPLRHGWTTHIAAPLFHTQAWVHFQLSLLLGSALVLRRSFDPFDCLETVSIQACESLVLTPEMMRRILELPDEVKQAFPLETVDAVVASGPAVPGDLARDWMDTFDDTLYAVYGSTDCAWATVATPRDLRLAPGTAGRPPIGTVLGLYDEAGTPVQRGEVGRIFVSCSPRRRQDTGDDLVATGDLGRTDAAGRLFIEGRNDAMVVAAGATGMVATSDFGRG
ncbi:MAG TPA: AMP-binding protein [Nocardioidaceae bacterium]|nr:AMP-binding protein [Nocardioidaceae bacterium]